MNLNAIATRIDELMKRQGLNRSQLAERAGVNNEMITRIMRGTEMKVSTFMRIADALDVPIMYLYDGRGSNELSEDEENSLKPAHYAPLLGRLSRGFSVGGTPERLVMTAIDVDDAFALTVDYRSAYAPINSVIVCDHGAVEADDLIIVEVGLVWRILPVFARGNGVIICENNDLDEIIDDKKSYYRVREIILAIAR